MRKIWSFFISVLASIMFILLDAASVLINGFLNIWFIIDRLFRIVMFFWVALMVFDQSFRDQFFQHWANPVALAIALVLFCSVTFICSFLLYAIDFIKDFLLNKITDSNESFSTNI